MTTLHDFTAQRLDGTPEALSRYDGDVVLVVNTASRCGFTPQYKGLEALQAQFAERRFTVLGFPCNQFGNQEPGDAATIGSFCERNYGVSFPMFAKVDVNGDDAHPLFAHLRAAKPGLFGTRKIKWNFTKFLIDRRGDVVKRYGPLSRPSSLSGAIAELL